MFEHQIADQFLPSDGFAELLAEPSKAAEEKKKKKRKKDKVRSAWISFTGRIVSQIVGAVATVALGVTVLHNHKGGAAQPAAPDDTESWRGSMSATSSPGGEAVVAVLPLENFSADPAHEYFADGMTEALTTSLSKVGGLHVVSRTSSMHFKGQHAPLREIASQLGVQWIVEGSITADGDRVRITAQLIDARTDQHIWAETYDRAMGGSLELQAEVAGAVTEAICGALHRPDLDLAPE